MSKLIANKLPSCWGWGWDLFSVETLNRKDSCVKYWIILHVKRKEKEILKVGRNINCFCFIEKSIKPVFNFLISRWVSASQTSLELHIRIQIYLKSKLLHSYLGFSWLLVTRHSAFIPMLARGPMGKRQWNHVGVERVR